MFSQLAIVIHQLVECDDSALADCWYRACIKLINPDQRPDASRVEEAVLGHGKAVRSVIHPAFDKLHDSDSRLQPLYANRALAPAKLVQRLRDDAAKERCLPTLLGLNKQLNSFPRWLVNENHTLSEQQVLATMRHIVAHGALLSNQSRSLGD